MRLEEALKYRRKGYDIKRLGWSSCLHERTHLCLLDLDADDWGVVRKRVAWPEAWEALKQGKKIKLHDGRIFARKWHPHESDYILWEDAPSFRGNVYGVPLSWLDRTDFEIVEDE